MKDAATRSASRPVLEDEHVIPTRVWRRNEPYDVLGGEASR